MRADRLLKLADFLDELPPAKFDFCVFTWIGEKAMLEALAAKDEVCGTVGCAIGWMPACFAEDGVKWSDDRIEPAVVYQGHTQYMAAGRFFDLNDVETLKLFSPERSRLGVNASPKQVADHIRSWVAARA